MDKMERAFWAKVDKSGDCWEWTAAKYRKGYGIFYFGNRRHAAHRWAYELVNGPQPGLEICHRCDNPSCVNPAHLFAGTKSDNMRDMYSKDRGAGWRVYHERRRERESKGLFRLSKLQHKTLAWIAASGSVVPVYRPREAECCRRYLVPRGLVAIEKLAPNRSIYSITPAGRAALAHKGEGR